MSVDVDLGWTAWLYGWTGCSAFMMTIEASRAALAASRRAMSASMSGGLVVVGLHGTAPWLRRLSGSEMYQPAGEVDGDEHDR